MQHFSQTASLLFRSSFYAFCVILLNANSIFATAISTYDSAGKPLHIDEAIEKDPDKYLTVMEVFLRQGRVEAVATIAKGFARIKGADMRVPALLSIYLAYKGDTDAAKKELLKARGLGNTPYVFYAEAMILRLEKKFLQGIEVCKKAIAMDERHPYPWNVLGRIYSDQGEIKNAYASFQKTVELEPNFLPGYINMGASAYMLGDDDSAVKFFKKAIQIDSQASNAHFGLGLVYSKIGQYELAAKEFEATFELDPENHMAVSELGMSQINASLYEDAFETGKKMKQLGLADAYLVLGDAALHMGKIHDAIEFLEQAATDRSEVNSSLGFCYMVLGENDKALTYMEVALKKNPNNFGAFMAKTGIKFALNKRIELDEDLRLGWGESIDKAVHFSRGCVLAFRSKWEMAAGEWQLSENLIQGFSIKGLNAQIFSRGLDKKELPYLNLGMVYILRDFYNPALEEFTSALDVNADSILSNYFIAQVYLKQGDRKKSILHLEKALEQAPDFFTALYSVAELNFLMGNPAQALDFYLRALEVHKDPGILLKVALYYENAGQLKEAEKYYEDLINEVPELYVGYNQLAWFYAKQGKNLEKALDLARKANVLMPGNASILDTLGWIHYHNQQYDKALEYLEHSEKVIPKNPTVLFHIGLTYFALGENNKSYAYLEKALELNDQFEGAEKAKEILESRNP